MKHLTCGKHCYLEVVPRGKDDTCHEVGVRKEEVRDNLVVPTCQGVEDSDKNYSAVVVVVEEVLLADLDVREEGSVEEEVPSLCPNVVVLAVVQHLVQVHIHKEAVGMMGDGFSGVGIHMVHDTGHVNMDDLLGKKRIHHLDCAAVAFVKENLSTSQSLRVRSSYHHYHLVIPSVVPAGGLFVVEEPADLLSRRPSCLHRHPCLTNKILWICSFRCQPSWLRYK
mmetsp:Transcript_19299/g.27284  ORF Transcript_19299/g.27284 Transcript_19299/m.27284 type:complete len:224 (-) Transcript_19299:59-730(-)